MYGRRSRGLSRAISLMRTALVSPPSTISLNTSSTMFLASAAPVLFSPFAHRLLRILMQPPMSTFAYHLDGHPQARYLAQFVQAVAHKHLATRELDPQVGNVVHLLQGDNAVSLGQPHTPLFGLRIFEKCFETLN